MTASTDVRTRLLQLRQSLEQPRPAGAEYRFPGGTGGASFRSGQGPEFGSVGAQPGLQNAPASGSKRPLREAMPVTAAMVQDLRLALGADVVDKLLRRAMAGHAGVYFAELAADGQVQEFGRLADGRRAVPVPLPSECCGLEWRDRHGRTVAPLPMVPRDLPPAAVRAALPRERGGRA